MTHAVLYRYLYLVADVFGNFEHLQGIVVLDCAPALVAETIFQVAKNRNLYLCCLPAGCTPYAHRVADWEKLLPLQAE